MRASGVRSHGRSPVSSWIPSGARSSSEMTLVTPTCRSVVQKGIGLGGKYSARSTGLPTLPALPERARRVAEAARDRVAEAGDRIGDSIGEGRLGDRPHE